jgi:hypothetical protein
MTKNRLPEFDHGNQKKPKKDMKDTYYLIEQLVVI